MRRRGSRAKALVVALFTALLWSGIMAGKSVAEPITYTDMGYTLTDMGTLGGFNSVPVASNEKGQVVGYSTIAGDVIHHAFLFSDGKMTDLGTLGGSYSMALAINNKGQVIGVSDIAGNLASHAFLYSNGKMTDLTPGALASGPRAINEKGQVIGELCPPPGGGSHAFLYSDEKMTDLGTLGGSESFVFAINEKGQAIGWSGLFFISAFVSNF
jgi:probable HAF family extracellular repeat protein